MTWGVDDIDDLSVWVSGGLKLGGVGDSGEASAGFESGFLQDCVAGGGFSVSGTAHQDHCTFLIHGSTHFIFQISIQESEDGDLGRCGKCEEYKRKN